MGIKTIGYQHSFINPKTSLFIDKSTFNPKKILTSGELTKKIFINKFKIENKYLKNFGSSKFQNTSDNFKLKNNLTKTILILPEGVIDEVHFMLNFVSSFINKYTDFNFILRLHPLTSLKNINTSKVLNLKNFLISNNSLEDDLNNSTHVLFRGSAAIIEAVNKNLIPIYLANTDELNLNHSFPKDIFIPKVNNIEDLKDLLDKKYNKDDINIFNNIKNFTKSYFDKYNFSSLIEI